MWSEPQRGREKEKERLIFYTFCTISSLFPPWRPLSAECAEYAFHGQEAVEPARTKKYEKKKVEREREGETLHLLSSTAIQKDGVITQKTSPPCFFTFYPGVPGTLSCYYDQNTWTAHRLPALTLRREEKTNAPRSKVHQPLFLSCITPNWCSCETANGSLGLRFNCG